MTAEEAERRVDSVHYCGGSRDERVFALKQWMAAHEREWYERRAVELRERAEAVR
jgi:hypothetical protein